MSTSMLKLSQYKLILFFIIDNIKYYKNKILQTYILYTCNVSETYSISCTKAS